MIIKNMLLPEQDDFVKSTAKEIMWSAAFGTGKSRGLCYKIFKQASIKNNTVGLCRKTRASLKTTTLRTLLKPEGHLPPVLPEGTYKHYKQDNVISIKGGGDILYFGFDDDRSIASMNLGSCGIDEGIELTLEEYIMILGRLRNTVDPYRQVYTATNPGHPRHFLYKRFFKEPLKIKDGTRCLIKSKSVDNFFLPKDYLKILNDFTGQRKARYVLGEWVTFEGLVYDIFNRKDHVMVRDCEFKEIILTLDEGYTNPAVILKCGIDGDGRIHIMQEFYERRVLQDRLIAEAQDMKGEYAIVDPSAASLIASMESKDITVEKGNNKVVPGIFAVLNRLKVQKDGLPRLTIDPSCTNTIMEFESYQWKGKEKEEPVKELNHAMDAARYLVMHLDAGDMVDPHIYRSEENKKKKADLKPGDEEYDNGVSKEERNRIEDDPNAWED